MTFKYKCKDNFYNNDNYDNLTTSGSDFTGAGETTSSKNKSLVSVFIRNIEH